MTSRSQRDQANRKRKGALRFITKACSNLSKYKAVRKKFFSRIKNDNSESSILFIDSIHTIIHDKEFYTREKYTALHMLKEAMEIQNGFFIEYFVDNLLEELTELAKFDLNSSANHRGATIFNDYEPEEREYGIKFIGLLGECFKNWGSSLDEKMTGVQKIQEAFYELLDLGAVKFSEDKYYSTDIVKSGELGDEHGGRVETEEDLFNNFREEVGYKPLPGVSKIEQHIEHLKGSRSILENFLHHNDDVDENFHLVQTQYEDVTQQMRKYIGTLNKSNDEHYYVVKVESISQFKFAVQFNEIYRKRLLTKEVDFLEFRDLIKSLEAESGNNVNESLHFSHESSIRLDRRRMGERNPFKKGTFTKKNDVQLRSGSLDGRFKKKKNHSQILKNESDEDEAEDEVRNRENSFGKKRVIKTGKDGSFISGKKSPEFAQISGSRMNSLKSQRSNRSSNPNYKLKRKNEFSSSRNLSSIPSKVKVETSLRKSPKKNYDVDYENYKYNDNEKLEEMEKIIEKMEYDHEEKIENLLHSIKLLEGDNNQMQLNFENALSKAEEKQNEVKILKKEIENLNFETEKLNNENNELLNELEKLTMKIKKGSSDQVQAVQNIYEKENRNLKQKLQYEKEKNRELKDEIEMLRKKKKVSKIHIKKKTENLISKEDLSLGDDSKEELIKMVNQDEIMIDEGSLSKEMDQSLNRSVSALDKFRKSTRMIAAIAMMNKSKDSEKQVKKSESYESGNSNRLGRKYKLKRDWLNIDVKDVIREQPKVKENIRKKKSKYSLLNFNKRMLARSTSDIAATKNLHKKKNIFNTPASYLVQSRYQKLSGELRFSSDRNSRDRNHLDKLELGDPIAMNADHKKLSPLVSPSTQEKTSGLEDDVYTRSDIVRLEKRSMLRGINNLKDPSKIYLNAINEIEQNLNQGISRAYKTHRGSKSLFMVEKNRHSKLELLKDLKIDRQKNRDVDDFKFRSEYRTHSYLERDTDFGNDRSSKRFLSEFQKKLDGILSKRKF